MIPSGYELWADGVWAQTPGAEPPDLGEGEGPTINERCPYERRAFLKRISIRPIWISALGAVRDVEPGPMSDPLIELSFLDVVGTPTSLWTSRAAITSRRALSDLAGTGWLPATSETAPILIRYLERAEAAQRDRAIVPVAQRLGPYKIVESMSGVVEWGWIWGSEWIGAGDGVRTDPRPGRTAHGTFAAAGAWDVWRARYAALVADSAVARVTIGATFASVLLRHLDLRTFILHHWYESGAGKTAIAMFAQSAWGDPDAEPLKTTFNRTEKSIAAVFAHVTDYPVLYDEKQVTTVRSAQFIYDVCGMHPRGRAQVDGTSRLDQPKWCALVRTTGETPLVETDDLGGQNNRVLQLHAAVDIADERLSDLYGFTRANHGHAGPRFLRRLSGIVNDPLRLANLKATMGIFAKVIQQRSGRNGNHVQYAAVIALAQWLSETWLLGIDSKVSRDRAIADAVRVLEGNVPELKQDYAEKALDRLRDHRIAEAANYIDGRALSADDLNAAIANAHHLVGMELSDEVLYLPSVINGVLRKSFLSPEKVWRAFAERGWIRAHKRKGRSSGAYQTVPVWILGKRVRVYALKASVMNDGQRGLDLEKHHAEARDPPELTVVAESG